jgi:hypothetical protein
METEEPKFENDEDEDLAQVVSGHGPCTYLLVSLLLVILVFPYGKNGGVFGKILLSVLFSMVLTVGAYATSRSRRSMISGMILATLGVILQWVALTTGESLFLRLLGVVYLIFLVHTIGSVLRYLLLKGPITVDKLHGALSGYIMIAFFWAFIYSLIESFTPGSFSIPRLDVNDPSAFYHLLYFSFTTLTTVGFGDILPVTDQARSLVMIEQLAGIFFVAVLIARLAGLYPPRSQ